MSWIALGLMIGACGKSASFLCMFGCRTQWRPNAGVRANPRRDYVTAGLYMLTRTNVIFQHSQTMMLVVAAVGAFTAIFAATIGITKTTSKKFWLIQPFRSLASCFWRAASARCDCIFHVMTHAFFKALMFLGAGSVIHGMHHEQDMRRMGGLGKYMKYTYWTFLAGGWPSAGSFRFSGFWSKDEILWRTAATNQVPIGWLLLIVGTNRGDVYGLLHDAPGAMTFGGKRDFAKYTNTRLDTKRILRTTRRRVITSTRARIAKIDVGAFSRAGDPGDNWRLSSASVRRSLA